MCLNYNPKTIMQHHLNKNSCYYNNIIYPGTKYSIIGTNIRYIFINKTVIRVIRGYTYIILLYFLIIPNGILRFNGIKIN